LYQRRLLCVVTTVAPDDRDPAAVREVDRDDLLTIHRIEKAAFPSRGPSRRSSATSTSPASW